MNIKTFIDRPILSVMLSIVIVIIGIIGLKSLPLEQYPDIAPPTVKVNATYVGANAETVMKSVATPLEASINGVENMLYMTSIAANNGTCTIIHTRIDGRDAQQNQTSSAGFLSVRLKNWSERTARADDIDSVVNEIYRRTVFIKEADVNCATLPTIRGYGSASGFELYVQNRSGEDFKALSVVARKFADALRKRPEIGKAHYTFNMDYPQYSVEVDAARCMMKNVSPGAKYFWAFSPRLTPRLATMPTVLGCQESGQSIC